MVTPRLGQMPPVVVADTEVWEDMDVGSTFERLGVPARAGSTQVASDAEVVGLMSKETRVLVTGMSIVSQSAMEIAPGLELIVKAGIGTDNIDLRAAESLNITVTRSSGANVNGVAEYTIGMMIVLSRRLVELNDGVRNGDWTSHRATTAGQLSELRGDALGIIGLGGIGRRLSELAGFLGMEVLIHDPPQEDQLKAMGSQVVDLAELLARSRYLSVNAVLTEETHHLIDDEAIGRMRRDAIVINAARGPIVDTHALAAALRDGRIQAAALDVFEEEPLPVDHPILEAPNCLLTPHIAGSTANGYREIGARVVEHTLACLRGTSIPDKDIVVRGARSE